MVQTFSGPYRSMLEAEFAQVLEALGYDGDTYESLKIFYRVPESRHTYCPDWPMPNGVIVEVKGRLRAEDRQKHLLLHRQYPELDIRFVFQRPDTHIAPESKTTYADWCKQHGIPCCGIRHTDIIRQWLAEPLHQASLAQLNKILVH